jgi:hypothetical protein
MAPLCCREPRDDLTCSGCTDEASSGSDRFGIRKNQAQLRRASSVTVQRGAKFGGALPQPFICRGRGADGVARPKSSPTPQRLPWTLVSRMVDRSLPHLVAPISAPPCRSVAPVIKTILSPLVILQFRSIFGRLITRHTCKNP